MYFLTQSDKHWRFLGRTTKHFDLLALNAIQDSLAYVGPSYIASIANCQHAMCDGPTTRLRMAQENM